MSEMQAWIEFYKSQSLVYFPLYGIINGGCRCVLGGECTNAGKHPRWRWKDQPSRVPDETDNVGISTDNLVVVDIDVPDINVISEYPETFTTTTGKGFHLWYRARDDSKEIKSVVGWKRKVDIRAHGGILVAPPSRHRSGADYRALNDSPIRPVTDDLLYAMPERSQNYHRTGQVATVELSDTPQLMFPMVSKLVTQMLEYGDGGRNQTLFRVACRFYEMSTKGLMGKDALSEIVTAAMATGLTQDEIRRTLDSAKRSI